jgi:alginate O-acetyltransferase complex protein AlgI
MAGMNGLPISADLSWQLSGLSCTVLVASAAGLFAGPVAARRLRRLAVRLWGSARGLRAALVPTFVVAVVRMTAESTSPFLYFQF